MAVYNGARHLAKSVESILGQTFPQFEFLIIDDGSTDESAAILDQYADSRIRVIHTENKGLGAALSLGVQESRAPFIARMDADDIALPHRLGFQIEALRTRPNLGLVDGGTIWIDEQDRTLLTSRRPSHIPPMLLRWQLLWQNLVTHPTVMLRRSVLEQAGQNYDSACSVEDYDLWSRINLITFIQHLPGYALRYRRTETGMTMTRDLSQMDTMETIQSRQFTQLLGKPLPGTSTRCFAALSLQTSLPVEEYPLQTDSRELIRDTEAIKAAFFDRFDPPPDERRLIHQDLAHRYLEWTWIHHLRHGPHFAGARHLVRMALDHEPGTVLSLNFLKALIPSFSETIR